MTLTDKQTGVFKGMVASLAITVASLALAIFGGLESFVLFEDASSAHAIKWDTLIIACLAINIGLLARHRFFTPDDIDGGGLSKGTPTAHILQSTLQNTLEQTVLALAVHAVWSSVMPPTWQLAIPTASILFVIGRILFWRGYAKGAPARALGFSLTFYPSVVMLLALGFRMVFDA
jgi:MAPEG family